MARAAVLGRLTWQLGNVRDTVAETPRVRSLIVDIAGWRGHRPGQHVDVRLTAEDGYQAVRSSWNRDRLHLHAVTAIGLDRIRTARRSCHAR